VCTTDRRDTSPIGGATIALWKSLEAWLGVATLHSPQTVNKSRRLYASRMKQLIVLGKNKGYKDSRVLHVCNFGYCVHAPLYTFSHNAGTDPLMLHSYHYSVSQETICSFLRFPNFYCKNSPGIKRAPVKTNIHWKYLQDETSMITTADTYHLHLSPVSFCHEISNCRLLRPAQVHRHMYD
jgi:hypothetical protein